jgi:hypothetical protein
MNNLGIKVIFSSPYLPRSNGKIEIVHKPLKSSIAAMCQSTFEWDTRLDFFKLHYNSSVHRATGFTPSMLFFGREISTPFLTNSANGIGNLNQYVANRISHFKEVLKEAQDNEQKMYKEYNVNNENLKNRTLQLGQIVYLKCTQRPGMLQPKFQGPFEVMRIFRNDNYLIRDLNNQNNRCLKRHISLLYAPQLATNSQNVAN